MSKTIWKILLLAIAAPALALLSGCSMTGNSSPSTATQANAARATAAPATQAIVVPKPQRFERTAARTSYQQATHSRPSATQSSFFGAGSSSRSC